MIKLFVDISLSPDWVDVFTKHGWPAVHWSTIGNPRAIDRVVMAWARDNGHVVFTHDLDFGTLLALTQATGPSVIQVRAHDVLPAHMEGVVVAAIRTYELQLRDGAIVTVYESRGFAIDAPQRYQRSHGLVSFREDHDVIGQFGGVVGERFGRR